MRIRLAIGGLGLLTYIQAVYLLVEDNLKHEDLNSFLLVNPCISCSKYNETLYDYKNASNSTKESIVRRLKCHESSKDNIYYFIKKTVDKNGKNREKRENCRALNILDGKIYVVKCDLLFPSICTNSGKRRDSKTLQSTDPKLSYTVNSTFGLVTGTRTDATFTFLGIPYALPPVGDLRFKDPVRISKINDTWNGTYYRSYCPQDSGTVSSPLLNEDCLYLNVYSPYIPELGDSTSSLLPVMVWIHGGSYIRGNLQSGYNDPSHLVSHENVVVVTLNYRLGVLGFWGCGNQAVKDQITALQWVRQYIGFFGGDPLRITIAGESAGASSVRTLLSAKSKTEGLAHAAVMMSDPVSMGFDTKDSAMIIAKLYAQVSGCFTEDNFDISSPKLMECMRKLTAEDVIVYQSVVLLTGSMMNDSITFGETFKPCIDGDVLTEDFLDSIETGDFLKVPLMLGTVRDEAAFFIDSFNEFFHLEDFLLFILSAYFNREQIQKIMTNEYYTKNLNSSDVESSKNFLSTVFTDAIWVCPTNLVAAKMSKYVSLYYYYYNYPYLWAHPPTSYCYQRICHADDLPAFLGSIAVQGIEALYDSNGTVAEPDLTFTKIILSRLGSFLRTHNPNPDPDKLCYNKEFFKVGDCDKRTVIWKTFQPNSSLEDAPSYFNNSSNGKVYGPVHILNITESTSGNFIVPRDICDFWYKLGLHAHVYSSKKGVLKIDS